MTGSHALVYPVLAQVFWTFVLMFWSGRRRVQAVRERRVRLRDIALNSDAYPDDVRKVSNNMQNQFETPIIFYVLSGVATYLGPVSLFMTMLAWVYVATRVAHTAVHVTTNRVEHRFAVFAVGVAALFLMWTVLANRLLITGLVVSA